jgi:hypothetical protein
MVVLDGNFYTVDQPLNLVSLDSYERDLPVKEKAYLKV